MMLADHSGADLAPPRNVIARLVRQIERSEAVAPATVEQATGRRVRMIEEDAYFRSYGAKPVRTGGSSYAIDLREPKPASGATGGAMLVIRVSGACVSKASLFARYSGLRLSDVPHARSPGEQTYWTRSEPWGELSFGFADSAPICLTSVVFTASRPSRAAGL